MKVAMHRRDEKSDPAAGAQWAVIMVWVDGTEFRLTGKLRWLRTTHLISLNSAAASRSNLR